MVTAEEIGRVAVFADLEPAERDWLSRTRGRCSASSRVASRC
jgi:hypothetical protein